MNHRKKVVLLNSLFLLYIHLSQAFTITDPGFFALGGDLVESGTVIRVSTSNLTVDLGGYMVSGGTNGIVIDAGLSNVTVQNGRIDSNTRGVTVGSNCSDITLQNITLKNCARRTVEVNGTDASPVMRLGIFNIISELSTTAASVTDSVMSFSNVVELTMDNVKLQKNGASTVNLTGMSFINCSKGSIENVTIINNQGATFQGFFIQNTTSFLMNQANVRMNTATGDSVGFRLTGGINTNGNFIQNCLVSNNMSTNGPLVGFEFLPFVTRNVLIGCVASNNITTAAVLSADCWGFNFDQPTFCNILNCRALNNQAQGNAFFNFGIGFNIGSSGGSGTATNDCEFNNCWAVGNAGAAPSRSFGIRASSNNVANTNAYLFCVAFGNGNVLANQITQGTGTSGAVPSGSTRTDTIDSLNGRRVEYGNLSMT
ncbi:MAG: hypothetical protein AB7E68_05690 [Candidatus Babeliales bacterium]